LQAVGKSGYFYKRPAQTGHLKFTKAPIGVNKLSDIVKNMCQRAGLQGYFTNHSGKRTCATVLYQAGIDEQAICDRTGHRSTAVREYKSSSIEQQKRISSILEPPSMMPTPAAANILTDCANVPDINKIALFKCHLIPITSVSSNQLEIPYTNCSITYNYNYK
jgi:hypothetical protein